MKLKRIMTVLMVVALLISLSSNLYAAEEQFKIGATIWDMSVPFYSNFIKGLEDGAEQFNFDLLLRDGQGDPSTQVAILQQFIVEDVDLIIIVAGDAEAVLPGILAANDANIPVISANNRVAEGADVLTFVGADDYYFGQQQAKLLIEAIGESGNVGYLMGKLGTTAQILRRNGFKDYLKDYLDIKIVSEISEGWDSAEALAASQDILSNYGTGELDAIVCQGPEAVPGAVYAQDSGREEVKWILGDYPSDVHDAIEDGIIYGTVNQDPYPQAMMSMYMANFYLTDRANHVAANNYFLALPLVTKENVDDFDPVW